MKVRHYRLRDASAADPFPAAAEPAESFVAEVSGSADLLAGDRRILTVSQLAQQIRDLFEQSFAYSIWVEGELSEPKIYPSGHLWFDLKDAQASLKCVMWRESVRSLRFKPEQGLQVVCGGRVEFYPRRGEVKFSVRSLEPKGMGALQLAFEQLKEKLQKEGLFAEERKRPLPAFPERIGLVTSPQGAAIDDMLRILRGHAQVILRPTRVQGQGAAESIAQAIRDLNHLEGLDLLIAGRGGGSLEDLWAFNEEGVARAIAGSRLPVISAVGHEKDVAISDLVADVRAPTPTKAAEIVLAQRQGALGRLAAALEEPAFAQPEEWIGELSEKVDDLSAALLEGLEQPLLSSAHRVKALHGELLSCSPQAIILHQAERLHRLHGSLCARMAHDLRQETGRVHALAGRLHALSPLAVLERGYSITFDPQGRILKRAQSVKPGDLIETRLHEGQLRSRVETEE